MTEKEIVLNELWELQSLLITYRKVLDRELIIQLITDVQDLMDEISRDKITNLLDIKIEYKGIELYKVGSRS